jgi:exosortase/archaeosortase family protein
MNWRTLRADLPAPLLQALVLSAGFMAFTAWDQSHWWRLKEDYAFGWLVPFFVAYVVSERWPAIIAAAKGRAVQTSRSFSAGAPAAVIRGLVGCALAGGAALFLFGALYRAAAGPSYPGTLAVALGTGAVTLSLIALATGRAEPVDAAAGADAGGGKLRVVGLFVFPALVWLVSAPMVSVVENALSLFLLGKVTSAVFLVFETLGLPIEQQGNVLVLPTGQVGVAEACSGIRSLMGCLFAGAFLGAICFNRLWKKIALLVAAMAFAFFTNVLRSLFLTAWAYRYGPAAIEGRVHDLAGYGVLAMTAGGLLVLVPLLNLRLKFESGPARPRVTASAES